MSNALVDIMNRSTQKTGLQSPNKSPPLEGVTLEPLVEQPLEYYSKGGNVIVSDTRDVSRLSPIEKIESPPSFRPGSLGEVNVVAPSRSIESLLQQMPGTPITAFSMQPQVPIQSSFPNQWSSNANPLLHAYPSQLQEPFGGSSVQKSPTVIPFQSGPLFQH